MGYPRLVESLIDHLMRFPGIGRRSAERIVFWLLDNSHEDARAFAKSVIDLKENLKLCSECHNLTEKDVCHICSDPARDKTLCCIVEDHKHLLAIERTGVYKGHYHVLMGPISPADGRGPDDIDVASLIDKIKSNQIGEVVIATDPDTEGEMTALHISKLLKPCGVKISRIGLGIPVGSSVEYADASTLSMSINSRREIEHQV